MIKYACEDHIDEAMDDVINFEETFPVISECINNKCDYCEKQSKYEVKIV